jgi:2-polyprenyl-3-methyl-5-hydroxy-6-metoxy-1,4-benzoquinol methylase/glycosyltransferase involved in cell wall biosynthesis
MSQSCWCGNTNLKDFSDDYWLCEVCSTLVVKSFPSADLTLVKDEDRDLYGKKYWLDHQVQQLGLPSIEERSRTDLLDRCAWWLEAALDFSLPPSRLLEVGCSHGGFLALAQMAGFRAVGVELSQWVAEFARKNFSVDVRVGPVERQGFGPATFDVICMFDVLEHLQDPVATLKCCAEALTLNGVLVIQTPQYPSGTTFKELQERQHPFLQMMLPGEHLFLFSAASVKRLLAAVGILNCEFVPARFAHYDMMLFAGKSPLEKSSTSARLGALNGSPSGRMIQSLFDALHRSNQLEAERQELAANFDHVTQGVQSLQESRDAAHQQVTQLNQQVTQLDRQIEGLNQEITRLSQKVTHLNRWLRQTSGEMNRALDPSLFSLGTQVLERIHSMPRKAMLGWTLKSGKRSVRVCIDLTGLASTGANSQIAQALLYLIKHLPRNPNLTFIYVCFEELFQELAALLYQNDRLVVVSPRSQKTYRGTPQVESIQDWHPEDPSELARYDPDVLYVPLPYRSRRAYRVNGVCFIPDLCHRVQPGILSPDEVDARESAISNTLSTAARVHVPSEHMRKLVTEFYPVSPNNVLVTHLRTTSVCQEIETPSRQYTFVCPEGYYSQESLRALLKAYKDYRMSAGSSVWGIVFSTSRHDYLERVSTLAKSLALEECLEFVEISDGKSFPTILKRAGALLYPVLHDGAGVPVIQALEHHVPAICSSTCSHPEIAGDAALYVNPSDTREITQTMLQVSSSADIRSKLVGLGVNRLSVLLGVEEQARKLAGFLLEAAGVKRKQLNS